MLRESNDGFVIAERDLEIRGPGEVLGTKQTGLAELKIADLSRDKHLLPLSKKPCFHLLQQHGDIAKPIILRWMGDRSELADLSQLAAFTLIARRNNPTLPNSTEQKTLTIRTYNR